MCPNLKVLDPTWVQGLKSKLLKINFSIAELYSWHQQLEGLKLNSVPAKHS